MELVFGRLFFGHARFTTQHSIRHEAWEYPRNVIEINLDGCSDRRPGLESSKAPGGNVDPTLAQIE